MDRGHLVINGKLGNANNPSITDEYARSLLEASSSPLEASRKGRTRTQNFLPKAKANEIELRVDCQNQHPPPPRVKPHEVPEEGSLWRQATLTQNRHMNPESGVSRAAERRGVCKGPQHGSFQGAASLRCARPGLALSWASSHGPHRRSLSWCFWCTS